jgi:hypothetical protein
VRCVPYDGDDNILQVFRGRTAMVRRVVYGKAVINLRKGSLIYSFAIPGICEAVPQCTAKLEEAIQPVTCVSP